MSACNNCWFWQSLDREHLQQHAAIFVQKGMLREYAHSLFIEGNSQPRQIDDSKNAEDHISDLTTLALA